jgi:hypothetical protein
MKLSPELAAVVDIIRGSCATERPEGSGFAGLEEQGETVDFSRSTSFFRSLFHDPDHGRHVA